MTANTIAYWNYLETVRANKARENLTQVQNVEANRHNLATEGLGIMNYSLSVKNQQETVRANMARETEVKRANLARERLDQLGLNETTRSHMATEALRGAELAESTRSHIANEMISAEHYNRSDTVAERNALVNEEQLGLNERSIVSQEQLNESRTKLNQEEYSFKTNTQLARSLQETYKAAMGASDSLVARNRADFAERLTLADLNSILTNTALKQKDLDYYDYSMFLNGLDTVNNIARTGASYVAK